MKKLNTEQLKALTLESSGPCISIYLSLDADFETVNTQWKTHLSQARFLLNRVREHTKNFQVLVDDLENFELRKLHKKKEKGVAIFKSFDIAGYFISPNHLSNSLVVSDTFHLKPVLPEIQDTNGYNILSLTKTKINLLECIETGIKDEQTFEMVRGRHGYLIWTKNNIETFFDFPQYNRKWLGNGFISLKRRKTEFHKFISFVMQILKDHNGFREKPLFVVADKELIGAFKSVEKIKKSFLITHPNVEDINDSKKLVNIVSQDMSRYFAREHSQALKEYNNLKNSKRVTDELPRIAQLALVGKVRKLFMARTSEIWGVLDKKSGKITYHPSQISSRDDDILDDIACEVIKQGGEVVMVDRKDMPTSSPLAAIIAS